MAAEVPLSKKPRISPNCFGDEEICDDIFVSNPNFYGDKEISDVILVAEEQEFHVHRMFFSARSTFFKELFAEHPPKQNGKRPKKTRINLDEKASDVSTLMNLVYKQTYGDGDAKCNYVHVSKAGDNSADTFTVKAKWQSLQIAMSMAIKYKVEETVIPVLERHFVFAKCPQIGCVNCALRTIFSLQFKFKNAIKHLPSDILLLFAVEFLQREMKISEFEINTEALASLFEVFQRGTITACENQEDENETEFSYGVFNLHSDVTIIVNDSKFNVHKMFLAARSTYFASMFFSRYEEKDKKEVEIPVDEIAFRGILDLLYRGHIDDKREFLVCSPLTEEADKNIIRFWQRLPPIMVLFKYFDLPIYLIEDLLCASWCGKLNCFQCGNKRLFAMHYKLNKVKAKITAGPMILQPLIFAAQKFLPETLSLTPDDLRELLSPMSPCSPIDYAMPDFGAIYGPGSPNAGFKNEAEISDDIFVSIPNFYGDKEISDVILVAEEQEFHVHRMFLAARSTFFKELFAKHPPKQNEKRPKKTRINLEEKASDVSTIMNLVYKQTYGDVDTNCTYVHISKAGALLSAQDPDILAVKANWQSLQNDMSMAIKYKFEETVIPVLERHFVFSKCPEMGCLNCAVRTIFSLQFNFKNAIKHLPFDCLIMAVEFLQREMRISEFEINTKALASLFEVFQRGIIKHHQNEEQEEKVEFTYGVSNLDSDVTILVNGYKFNVHKMFLAARSSYFASMFFSRYEEKDKKEVEIPVDEIAFRGILDLLYRGHIDDKREFLVCSPLTEEADKNIIRFWQRLPPIMDLFKYFDLPIYLIEDLLCASWCGKLNCFQCGNKRLFAMHYKLNKVKAKTYAEPMIIQCLIYAAQKYLPETLLLLPTDFSELLSSMLAPLNDPTPGFGPIYSPGSPNALPPLYFLNQMLRPSFGL